MLVNISNHPSSKWDIKQLEASRIYGKIVDLSFPEIDPQADEKYIATLTDKYIEKIKQINVDKDIVIHLMGEMTFSFALVKKLNLLGIECIVSTSKRISYDLGNGRKKTTFCFERFRKYI